MSSVTDALCKSLVAGSPAGTPDKDAAEPSAKSASSLESLFGVQARFAGNGDAMPLYNTWRNVRERMDSGPSFAELTSHMPEPVETQWRNLEAQFHKMDPRRQLRAISGFFNLWEAQSDRTLYGKEDYWATPAEFVKHYGGDCEDYALAKYEALKYLGRPSHTMWVVVLLDTLHDETHAVLVVKENGDTFVLDNLSQPKNLVLTEKPYKGVYFPFYAVNDHGLWFFPDSAKERKSAKKKF